jgi:hypothetical protein
MLHFIYFFSTTISIEYSKHAAHSQFFSSKCLLIHNATFLVHVRVLFTFNIQGVLKLNAKFKVCKSVNHRTIGTNHQPSMYSKPEAASAVLGS